MKTPMEDTLEQIERALNITISDEDKTIYLEKEKQVIIDAWKDGYFEQNTIIDITKSIDYSDRYYNETFKKL